MISSPISTSGYPRMSYGVSLGDLRGHIQGSSLAATNTPVGPLAKSYPGVSPPGCEGMTQRRGTRYARLLRVLTDVSGIAVEWTRGIQTLCKLSMDSIFCFFLLVIGLQQQLDEAYDACGNWGFSMGGVSAAARWLDCAGWEM